MFKGVKQKYNIDASDSHSQGAYLYPQELINYLMKTDEKINNIITTNAFNQWETIYILVMVLNKKFNINQKNQVFKFLIEKTGPIPEIILNQ